MSDETMNDKTLRRYRLLRGRHGFFRVVTDEYGEPIRQNGETQYEDVSAGPGDELLLTEKQAKTMRDQYGSRIEECGGDASA